MKTTRTSEALRESEKAVITDIDENKINKRNVFQTAYDLIAAVGSIAIRQLVLIRQKFGSAWSTPRRLISYLLSAIKLLFTRHIFRTYLEAGVHFRTLITEYRNSRQFRKSRGVPHTWSSFKKDCKTAFERHRKLFTTSFNTALPIAAAIILVTTVSYWNSVTFALGVNLDDHLLGYVSDESVYAEAEKQVLNRVGSTVSSSDTSAQVQQQSADSNKPQTVFLDAEKNDNPQTAENVLQHKPSYKLSLVSIDKLVDADTLCDKILETSNSNITNGCGIYIDNEFICALKNETDAKSVFDNILEQYRQKASANSIIDFVEEIEFVQGLYSDNESVIWTTEQLQAKLASTKAKAVYHEVKDGETPSGIAHEHDLTTSELVAMNPWVEEVIHVGDQILVSNQVNFLQIKEMRTVKRQEPIKFEKEEVETNKLYTGKTRTRRTGKDGLAEITEMVTVIDGVVTSTTQIGKKVLQNPVNEIVEVGIKSKPRPNKRPGSSSSAGSAIIDTPSGGRFAWPAPGLYTITAGYPNYANGRYHGGLDISGPSAGGKPVVAAESGVVTSAGWNSSGYGYRVVIDHGNGLQTTYNHMQKGSISVKVGQKVKRGQTIGRVGSTGNSSGNHLHFEVIRNGTRVNPKPYLGL